jgi:hypothetical protein
LKKSPDEVGAMEFPFVMELLDYWLEWPPEHVLIKLDTGYEGPKKDGKSKQESAEQLRRRKRAEEMGDTTYKPEGDLSEGQKVVQTMGANIQNKAFAPGHIKEAIDRAKRNTMMDIPGVPN